MNEPSPVSPDLVTPEQQRAVRDWHRLLRDQLCGVFERLEQDAASGPAPQTFRRRPWRRETSSPEQQGGGGVMSVMRDGRVFEKAGVNISTVHGAFSEQFRREIPGAQESNGAFWASGLSLVAHPRNPHVPAAHFNTRMIVTDRRWFGGGADLNPPLGEDAPNARRFHQALKDVCDAHDPGYYPRFRDHCDRYFFLPHRNCPRGVGGIFFDNLNTGHWETDFGFIQDVGRAFRDVYGEIVAATMNRPWSQTERDAQLAWRGRYVEFNLIYDRGTRFGLQTGGNPDAVLMSLPPLASW